MRTDQHHAFVGNVLGILAALFAFSGFMLIESAATKLKQSHECAKLSNGEVLQESHYPWNCHKETK